MDPSINKVLAAVQEEFPRARSSPASSSSGKSPSSSSNSTSDLPHTITERDSAPKDGEPSSNSSKQEGITTTTFTAGLSAVDITGASSSSTEQRVSSMAARSPPLGASSGKPNQSGFNIPLPNKDGVQQRGFAFKSGGLRGDEMPLTPGVDDIGFSFRKKEAHNTLLA